MKTLTLFIILVLARIAAPALATDLCKSLPTEKPLQTLQRLNSVGTDAHCLGRALDSGAIAIGVWDSKATAPLGNNDVELKLLFADAQEQLKKIKFESSNGLMVSALFATALSQAESLAAIPHAADAPPREAFKTNHWEVSSMPGNIVAVDLSAIGPGWTNIVLAGPSGVVPPECFNSASAGCEQNLGDAESIATVANRISLALVFFGDSALPRTVQNLKQINAAWDAYFKDARSQSPLELWINDLAFRDSSEFRNNAKSASASLIMPPNHQYIFMHPRAAFEFVGSAGAGSRLKPAALIEVLGYNHWSYNPDGTMGNAYGVSLIASYSDRAGAKAVGFGPMFYFKNKYAIGVTFRKGSSIGITVSTDLQSLLLKYGDSTQSNVKTGTYGP